MEQQVSTSHVEAAQRILADTVDALRDIEVMLEKHSAIDCDGRAGHLDLITKMLVGGGVDMFYRGTYLRIPLARLGPWLRDPAVSAARNFGVEKTAFGQWSDISNEQGVGSTVQACGYPGCQMTKTIIFEDPAQMAAAERSKSSGLWFCHHHRLAAWQKSGVLGDKFVEILAQMNMMPGASRTKLAATKQDMEFLESIGLGRVTQVSKRGATITSKYYATESGVAYLDKL